MLDSIAMRTRKNELEFATFLCKFGSKDLIDGLEQVVLPAFFSNRKRKYGKASYCFHKPQIVSLPGGYSGIAFEFVKNTVLEREQIFEPEMGLVEDQQSMDSAPSALALLILDTHRLVYFPKTKFAPSVQELEATCANIFRAQWGHWLQNQLMTLSGPEKAVRRASAVNELPRPSVTILPLSSAAQIESSLQLFHKIQHLSIALAETNNEYDPNEFFEQLRKEKRALGSQTTRVQHSSPSGLDMSQVKEDVRAATQQGSARVRVKGLDAQGQTFTQENEDLRVRIPAHFDPGENPADVATPMYDALATLEISGMVKAPSVMMSLRNRVQMLLDRWRDV